MKTITVWYMKYALTSWVIKYAVVENEEDYFEVKGFFPLDKPEIIILKKDCYFSLEEAQNKFKDMKIKKMDSLNKLIKKVSSLEMKVLQSE